MAVWLRVQLGNSITPSFSPRAAQAHDLGVGGRIVPHLCLIVAEDQEFAVAYDRAAYPRRFPASDPWRTLVFGGQSGLKAR
jgi:hypothetical protein